MSRVAPSDGITLCDFGSFIFLGHREKEEKLLKLLLKDVNVLLSFLSLSKIRVVLTLS